ncbi:MAG: T9SS type A sorting domain-containing protein [Calditrichia bacterium]
MASTLRHVIACVLLCLLCLPSQAGWPTEADSAIFVDFGLFPYVSVAPVDQSVFVVYIFNGRLFAKKYDRYGDSLWGGNRATLGDTTEMFGRVVGNLPRQWGAVVPDDNGGLYVCWQDYRHSQYNGSTPITNDIYIQYVDSNGLTTMGAHGKRLNTLQDESHLLGDMKTDYHGGVFVGFSRDSTSSMSVVKRIQSNGTILWKKYFNETSARIAATSPQGDVFVNVIDGLPGRRQKLDIGGNALWPDTLSGRIPTSPSYPQGRAFANNDGGVYGISRNVFEVRFNHFYSDGNPIFGEDIIIPTTNIPSYYASDNDEGFFFQATAHTKPLRRIRKNGSLAWGNDVFITQDSMWSGINGIESDLEGGIIGVASTGIFTNGSFMLAQRLDSIGQHLWQPDGVIFHSSPHQFEGAASSIVRMASDGRGGIVVSWVLSFQGLRIYIKQISKDGIIGDAITGVNRVEGRLPEEFSLFQNFPNPFNAITQIQYQLEGAGKVTLTVYSILGQRIRTLVEANQQKGTYDVSFNALGLPTGIYFYQLNVDNVVRGNKKMLILN